MLTMADSESLRGAEPLALISVCCVDFQLWLAEIEARLGLGTTKRYQCSPAQFHSPLSGVLPQRFCNSTPNGTRCGTIRGLNNWSLHSRRKNRLSNAPVATVLLALFATGFGSQG